MAGNVVVSPQRQAVDFRRGAAATILLLSLVLSAYAMAAGLGSAARPWFGWAILPPLFVAIRFLAPHRALTCGLMWGGCVFTFSVATFQTPVPPTLFSLLLLAAIPAMYAYVCARVTRDLGFCALLLAFGWMGVELSLSLLGLRNGLLVGTQTQSVFVEVVGGLFGSVFVAFVIAFVNASVLSMLTDAGLTTDPPKLGVGWAERGRLFWELILSTYGPAFVRAVKPRAPPLAR